MDFARSNTRTTRPLAVAGALAERWTDETVSWYELDASAEPTGRAGPPVRMPSCRKRRGRTSGRSTTRSSGARGRSSGSDDGGDSDHDAPGAPEQVPPPNPVAVAARRCTIRDEVAAASSDVAGGLRRLLGLLEECRTLGIRLGSLGDCVDPHTPIGSAVAAAAATDLPDLRRALAAERVRAGMAAAKLRGTRVGRPHLDLDLARAHRLIGRGRSQRQVATSLGISASTLNRALQRSGQVAAGRDSVASTEVVADAGTPPLLPDVGGRAVARIESSERSGRRTTTAAASSDEEPRSAERGRRRASNTRGAR